MVPLYMLVVFVINILILRLWNSPVLKRAPKWRLFARFTAWVILLGFVPVLALIALEERNITAAATVLYAAAIGGAAFWLSNASFDASSN